MSARIVLVRDLVGTPPITVDIRSRHADGSLTYPEQQKTPMITMLEKVTLEKRKGQTWLYWYWSPVVGAHCNYSGIVATSLSLTDTALEVQS